MSIRRSIYAAIMQAYWALRRYLSSQLEGTTEDHPGVR